MRQVLMNVSDEFYQLLLTSMLTPDVQLAGMDFYFDSLKSSNIVMPIGERLIEEVPILTCNAAFRTFMSSKGNLATRHILDSDERLAEEKAQKKEMAEKSPGWTFQEGAALAFGNLNGEVVPLNEESRKILRKKNFHEILGFPKGSPVQEDYEEADESFSGGSFV